MTIEIDTQLLRTLHRVLQQLTDLNSRMERAPVRVNVANAAEAAFLKTLEDARVVSKETKLNADRKQRQLQECEARIEELKTKRNACESNREFQLLNDQIAADEQANSVQADEIFELLEKMDVCVALVEESEANLEKGKLETAKVEKVVADELATLQRDLEEVKAELANGESLLPHEVRKEYKRMVEAIGEDALAEVNDNSCGHCYTNVTTQLISELMMKRATFCKCGSLLYLANKETAS